MPHANRRRSQDRTHCTWVKLHVDSDGVRTVLAWAKPGERHTLGEPGPGETIQPANEWETIMGKDGQAYFCADCADPLTHGEEQVCLKCEEIRCEGQEGDDA